MFDFTTRVVPYLTPSEREEVVSLLSSSDLAFDEGADAVALVEDTGGAVAATASLFGSVIRMVAVSASCRESGLSAVAISALMEAARVGGVSRLFLYAKPDKAARFASLGFRNLAESGSAALLETGEPGVGVYRKYLFEKRAAPDEATGGAPGKIGAIVANCNPFTLGHRYLVERASSACRRLYVIVVEENRSLFSFEDRYAMVEAGLSGFGNATLLRSGSYAVSDVTFPTYFLKDRSELAVASEQARLDLSLFCRLYAPALGINARFVGTEPDSAVTRAYNEAMKDVLPAEGIEVVEVERLPAPDGAPISASAARRMMSSGDISKLSSYLPPSTIEYMREKSLL
ncbi:MAG: [citrate (pro-3S)-lyase] ligase [Synergistaceae bacterium]|nr:[citrate (pro-3S)-lyase] ligase [Synergistaceae bacterium]